MAEQAQTWCGTGYRRRPSFRRSVCGPLLRRQSPARALINRLRRSALGVDLNRRLGHLRRARCDQPVLASPDQRCFPPIREQARTVRSGLGTALSPPPGMRTSWSSPAPETQRVNKAKGSGAARKHTAPQALEWAVQRPVAARCPTVSTAGRARAPLSDAQSHLVRRLTVSPTRKWLNFFRQAENVEGRLAWERTASGPMYRC